MRANTKDGRIEWWEGSGVKVRFRASSSWLGGEARHACVVASGYSPYFCTDTVYVCTIVMSGTCANVMDSCPIRKNLNPYLYPYSVA